MSCMDSFTYDYEGRYYSAPAINDHGQRLTDSGCSCRQRHAHIRSGTSTHFYLNQSFEVLVLSKHGLISLVEWGQTHTYTLTGGGTWTLICWQTWIGELLKCSHVCSATDTLIHTHTQIGVWIQVLWLYLSGCPLTELHLSPVYMGENNSGLKTSADHFVSRS